MLSSDKYNKNFKSYVSVVGSKAIPKLRLPYDPDIDMPYSSTSFFITSDKDDTNNARSACQDHKGNGS